VPHPAAYFRDKGPRRESPYGRRAFRSKRDLPRPTLVGDSTKTRGENAASVDFTRENSDSLGKRQIIGRPSRAGSLGVSVTAESVMAHICGQWLARSLKLREFETLQRLNGENMAPNGFDAALSVKCVGNVDQDRRANALGARVGRTKMREKGESELTRL